MRIKYKGILGIISFLIFVTLVVGISYLFYEHNVAQNDYLVFVEDELSINYLNTNIIQDSAEYKFSITNTSNNEVYYEINLVKENNDSDLIYDLNCLETDINIKEATLTKDDLNSIVNKSIDPKETHNYRLKLTNNLTSVKIEVKKVETLTEYFAQTIIKNSDPTTLIKDSDDYGDTYYFKGNVLNNYVKLNDTLWRIVRINGDNTIRLVLDGVLEDANSYNSTNNDYEEFTITTIHNAIEAYFNIYLVNNPSIVNSKFCQENGKTNTLEKVIYNAYNRITINNIPTFNCLGTTYVSKFGLLSIDEVVFSLVNEDNNVSSYLINSDISNSWWTSSLALATDNNFIPFSISTKGEIETKNNGTEYLGVRPVINLSRNTLVEGTGTLNNPYILM